MNPLQRASAIRKVIYLAAILVLFTISMVWRGVIPVPLGNSPASAATPFRWTQEHTIQNQAKRLEVWEQDPEEGEADVSGSAMRLALLGSRGVVVTGLWLSAIDKQKRNDFHELEQRVQAVTRLQPNFITPWIFQSWNIAYNVSVEMHGSGDMYYYIVRGIQLLAEGERRNKRSPDMRYQIAFYYQNKFGVSDQVEVLRCLYDLSCMPPSERNPDRYEDPATKAINFEEFKKLCERHPHFVRRLRGEIAPPTDRASREKLRAPRPEDVIHFLRVNYQDLPCRYRKDTLRNIWTDELAEPEPDRVFPVLPPLFPEGPEEAHRGILTPDDYAPGYGYFSAFKAARAWFSYSLPLLPPSIKDEQGKPLPGPTPPPGQDGHDPSKHRVPRMPTLIIFRQGAPRAQTYQAELEQKEGWFDGEGWRIERWFPENREVVVGTRRPWSLMEWEKAAKMWKDHGEATGLSMDAARLAQLERLAGPAGSLPPSPTQDQMADENLRRRYRAEMAIQFYRGNRTTTNFPYFLASAETEQMPMTVEARKKLWQGEQARKLGEPTLAIELYKDGLERWKQVLLARFKTFFRPDPPERGDRAEEETYEFELSYMRLLVEHDARVRKVANEIARAFRFAGALAGVMPFSSLPFSEGGKAEAPDPFWSTASREELKWFVVENVGGAPFSSPFVGSPAPDGNPWIQDYTREGVRTRQGITHGQQQPKVSSEPLTPIRPKPITP